MICLECKADAILSCELFSGITYFISVAMTLKTVLPNFFFP